MNQNKKWGLPNQKGDRDDPYWKSLLADENAAPRKKRHFGKGKNSNRKDKKEKKLNWVDWTRILELQENETICYGEVTEFNRGGLLVRAQEFEGFVPRSHLLETKPRNVSEQQFLEKFIGQELELKVIECDPERGRIVLSQRAAQSQPGSKQLLRDSIENNTLVEGKVTNITPFGLFLDLGGIEGLVHISELSWGRVAHPREVASVGDTISVIVLEMDEGRGRVSLSLKQGTTNPWVHADEQYPPGTTIEVEISEVVQYGAFAKITDGLEGLIHISQMGLHERLDPRLVYQRGMRVQVQVLDVEKDNQRISLQLIPGDEPQEPDFGEEAN
jgi:small subunit ribosomal protein S1